MWQTDGPDSTGFGVAPNFGCCTANLNQGWSVLNVAWAPCATPCAFVQSYECNHASHPLPQTDPPRAHTHLPLRPKFASNVFLSSPEDGGLVLAMIAPVIARVGDTVAEVWRASRDASADLA